jgi:hypothetical protein
MSTVQDTRAGMGLELMLSYVYFGLGNAISDVAQNMISRHPEHVSMGRIV